MCVLVARPETVTVCRSAYSNPSFKLKLGKGVGMEIIKREVEHYFLIRSYSYNNNNKNLWKATYLNTRYKAVPDVHF